METLLAECVCQLYERCVLDACILFRRDGQTFADERREWLDIRHIGQVITDSVELHVTATSLIQQFILGKVQESVICLSHIPALPDIRVYVFLKSVGEEAILLGIVGSDILERQGSSIEADMNYAVYYLEQLLSCHPLDRLQWPTDGPDL